MGSIQKIGNKLYANVKTVSGSWQRVSTGRDDTRAARRVL